MFFEKGEFFKRIFLTGSIGMISIIGDMGLKYGKTHVQRAVFDNLTHACVGGLAWILILNLSRKTLSNHFQDVSLCFTISSLIDVDHFIMARSWHLDDATNLNGRPFLHCTTLPIVLWFFLISISKIMDYPSLGIFSWLILTSFLTHHIRDATRRGLWFFPIGSTPPLPYSSYIIISMILPYILHCLMTWLTPSSLTSHYTYLKSIDFV